MSTWGRIGVFDLETTGVDVDTSRIVSACVAVLDANGDLVDRWDWLANPGIEIPEGAAAIHGITTERARAEGRDAETVIAEITQTLRTLIALEIPIVVYNAPYDLTLLDRECRRHRLEVLAATFPIIDPLVMDKAVDRYRKGKRTLEVTAERYGVTLDDAHDAGSDAIAAGRVALSLARAYPEQLDRSAAELHELQVGWYASQAASFERYMRTSKGEESFVADREWPIRGTKSPASFLDTQPIPAPTPRQSETVPYFDFGLSLPREIESAPPSAPAASAPPVVHQPSLFDAFIEPEELEFVELESDLEHIVPAHDVPEPVDSDAQEAPDEQPAQVDDEPPAEVDLFGYPLQATGSVGRLTVLRIAAGIVTDGAGRTLLVRKAGTTAFMQAGGKIEEGESAFDALARELMEELGLEVDPDTTEYLGSHRAVAANEPDTVVRAEVFAVKTQLTLEASAEIEEILWIDDAENIPVELAPLTRDTILPLWTSRRSSLF